MLLYGSASTWKPQKTTKMDDYKCFAWLEKAFTTSNQVNNTPMEACVSLSTIMRSPCEYKCSLYNEVESTGFPEEQEGQIRLCKKASKRPAQFWKKKKNIYIYGQIKSRLTCTIQMGVWRRETALLNILWQECGLWYAAVEGWGQVCVLWLMTLSPYIEWWQRLTGCVCSGGATEGADSLLECLSHSELLNKRNKEMQKHVKHCVCRVLATHAVCDGGGSVRAWVCMAASGSRSHCGCW